MLGKYPTPSYKTGFASCAEESEFPELWQGLLLANAPILGIVNNGRYNNAFPSFKLPYSTKVGTEDNNTGVRCWSVGPLGVGFYSNNTYAHCYIASTTSLPAITAGWMMGYYHFLGREVNAGTFFGIGGANTNAYFASTGTSATVRLNAAYYQPSVNIPLLQPIVLAMEWTGSVVSFWSGEAVNKFGSTNICNGGVFTASGNYVAYPRGLLYSTMAGLGQFNTQLLTEPLAPFIPRRRLFAVPSIVTPYRCRNIIIGGHIY